MKRIDQNDVESHWSDNKKDTEKQRNEDVTIEQSNPHGDVPIDRGWAWVVLIGSSVMSMVMVGLLKCGGILFVQIQRKFRSTSAETSLISSVMSESLSVSSLVVMTIGMKVMTCRTAVIIGTMSAFVAFLIMAFAEDIALVIFANGVLYGTAVSLTLTPSLALVGQYFERWRGLANSLTLSGSSLGGLTFAPFLTFLFDHYGYTGACLIIAGVTFNLLITAAAFRPLSSYSFKVKSGRKGTSRKSFEHDLKVDKPTRYAEDVFADSEKQTPRENGEAAVLSPGTDKKPSVCYDELLKDVNMKPSQSEDTSKCTFVETSANISFPETDNDAEENIKEKLLLRESLDTRVCNTYRDSMTEFRGSYLSVHRARGARPFLKMIKQVFFILFDPELFKDPVFVFYIISMGLLESSLSLITVFIAPLAKDIGSSDQQISVLFTVIGSLDLFSRIMFGVLADRNYIDRAYIISIAASIVGVACQLVELYTTYTAVLIFSVIHGVFGAAFYSLFAVLLADFFGVEKLQSSLGVGILFIGICGSAASPTVGALRDRTGSYTAPFHLLGSIILLGAICCCIANVLFKRKQSSK